MASIERATAGVDPSIYPQFINAQAELPQILDVVGRWEKEAGQIVGIGFGDTTIVLTEKGEYCLELRVDNGAVCITKRGGVSQSPTTYIAYLSTDYEIHRWKSRQSLEEILACIPTFLTLLSLPPADAFLIGEVVGIWEELYKESLTLHLEQTEGVNLGILDYRLLIRLEEGVEVSLEKTKTGVVIGGSWGQDNYTEQAIEILPIQMSREFMDYVYQRKVRNASTRPSDSGSS